ncbi:MAG: tRNA uridine-5-carboxymethylaminomethyl(34) synthesis GTPase MnmE, partial [Bacteroidota bacterium]
MPLPSLHDTITALATPQGVGAIAVIRTSGKEAISITSRIFCGKDLMQQPSHTLHFGEIRNQEAIVDEVLISIFKAPTSFTKENATEISCHGSSFIIQQILQLLIEAGARLAKPGEFTQRAFLNGRFDLAQAEAVADLIAADSKASHAVAINQMRGGFSKQISSLREELIQFAALIELELDFSEEDVEFANREQLKALLERSLQTIIHLIQSFSTGKAMKEGIPTVIVGKPNAGKSTLLNALLEEDKAIVSDIEGTTRDSIEDETIIEGVKFRFIDTAGLRDTSDTIEAIGVRRAKEKMQQATLILYLFDVLTTTPDDIAVVKEEIKSLNKPFLLIGNKVDQVAAADLPPFEKVNPIHWISAQSSQDVTQLGKVILSTVIDQNLNRNEVVLTNTRHYEALVQVELALQKVKQGILKPISSDLLALDIREAIRKLGEITGEVTTDDLLG